MRQVSKAVQLRVKLAVNLCTFFAQLFEGREPVAERKLIWWDTGWCLIEPANHWASLSQGTPKVWKKR